MKLKALIIAATVAFSPISLSAATVDINITGFGSLGGSDLDKAGAQAALTAFIGSAPRITTETFGGFTPCPGVSCDSNPSTSVGSFSAEGPFGSGATNVAPNNEAVIRHDGVGNTGGRYGVLSKQWLDSNDATAINWSIPGESTLSNIVRLAFFLTDVQDVHKFAFQLSASGSELADVTLSNAVPGDQKNGALFLVTMSFSQSIDDLAINLRSGTNDGFGIAGVSVAAVPLPAGGLLLISALGGMAVLRRRQKARSAVNA